MRSVLHSGMHSMIFVLSFLVMFASAQITSVSADHGQNFHCNFNSFIHPDAKAAIDGLAGTDRTLRSIVEQYALRWEDEEIRRICDAAAAGKDVDFGCLGGRQNWAAIEKRLSQGLLKREDKDRRRYLLQLQSQRINSKARTLALDYCGALGLVDRGFR